MRYVSKRTVAVVINYEQKKDNGLTTGFLFAKINSRAEAKEANFFDENVFIVEILFFI